MIKGIYISHYLDTLFSNLQQSEGLPCHEHLHCDLIVPGHLMSRAGIILPR